MAWAAKCQSWLFLPPTSPLPGVTVHKLAKHLIKAEKVNCPDNASRTLAETSEIHSNGFAQKCTSTHSRKSPSPFRPRRWPGGSALSVYGRRKKGLRGNLSQQPVGIISVGRHLASCGPQRWPRTQLLLQLLCNDRTSQKASDRSHEKNLLWFF